MDIDIDPALDALGDPMRRRIVGRLAAGPLDVGGIAAGMPVGRTAVSMHLRVLKAAGLVSDQADGNRRVYHLLLVQGNFRIDLTETTITLEKQGDYAAWGPGIDHSWEAISDSVVVTVRWPSSLAQPGRTRTNLPISYPGPASAALTRCLEGRFPRWG